MIDFGLIFTAGLLASMHCIGMCGPIVLAYSTVSVAGGAGVVQTSAVGLHAAYNAGRIIGYSVLGAIAGMIGATLASLNVLTEVIATAGGVVMIIAGLAMLGWLPIPAFMLQGRGAGLLRKIHKAVLVKRTISGKFSLGLLTPLLPCGLLYAMFVKAATAGSVVAGAATMGVFGLGMAPSLILMGSLSSIISARLRRGTEQLAAVMIILMGIFLVLRGFHVPYLAWMSGGSGEMKQCH